MDTDKPLYEVIGRLYTDLLNLDGQARQMQKHIEQLTKENQELKAKLGTANEPGTQGTSNIPNTVGTQLVQGQG